MSEIHYNRLRENVISISYILNIYRLRFTGFRLPVANDFYTAVYNRMYEISNGLLTLSNQVNLNLLIVSYEIDLIIAFVDKCLDDVKIILHSSPVHQADATVLMNELKFILTTFLSNIDHNHRPQ